MKIKMSTRIVFLFKDYVIKIPISIRGYLQSKQEEHIWEEYGHLGLIGELYWCKRGVVCMKRYKPVKEVPHSEIFKVKHNIEELDITVCDCDLYNFRNWGVDENGEKILIDYGISEFISKLYNI